MNVNIPPQAIAVELLGQEANPVKMQAYVLAMQRDLKRIFLVDQGGWRLASASGHLNASTALVGEIAELSTDY